ncbi:MAG: zf-TFIIB domain-containing protein [Gemmatimonadetes bacterium]|nr:zf-TFIIB domain-containing protein [Gemmatimonadota bacterium]
MTDHRSSHRPDDFKPPHPADFRKPRTEDEYFLKLDAELIKAHRARLDAERERAERHATHNHCPKCDGVLQETRHGHIMIDVCPKCKGVWLDAGEMEMIEHVKESNVGSFFSDLLKGLSQK